VAWLAASVATTGPGFAQAPAAGDSAAVPAPAPAAVPDQVARQVSWRGHRVGGFFRYNRVEGAAPFVQVARPLHGKDRLPAYRAHLGYAFAAERGQYLAEIEQPLVPGHRWIVGGAVFRAVIPFYLAEETVSSLENTASALFLHRDYWDVYEAEGFRGFARVGVAGWLQLRAGYTGQDEAPLATRADWSVFRQEEDFEANPPVPEGESRVVELLLEVDSRPADPDFGTKSRAAWGAWEHWSRVVWERGDGGLGGDVDYWKMTADVRTAWRLSPRQEVVAHILAGAGEGREGTLPPQRRYELGGLGTLHGHRFRSLAGDRAALLNVEVSLALHRRVNAVVFGDAGTAWDAGTLFDQRIPVDLGAGVRLGATGPMLLAARTVNAADADVRVHFRLRSSF
jgi:hypothetical protein